MTGQVAQGSDPKPTQPLPHMLEEDSDVPMLDQDGKPLIDASGNPVTMRIHGKRNRHLDRPSGVPRSGRPAIQGPAKAEVREHQKQSIEERIAAARRSYVDDKEAKDRQKGEAK